MATSPQQHLSALEESINALVEQAEQLAEDNSLEFTVRFKNRNDVNVDWTQSWSSSYE
jgi:galactose-1-phosphate uridylyltransferase